MHIPCLMGYKLYACTLDHCHTSVTVIAYKHNKELII